MRQYPSSGRRLALGAPLLLLVLAGCGSNVTSPTPTATATPSSAPPTASSSDGPTSVPTDPGATGHATPPTQTETEWGRIWDALPVSFPVFPGASPTEIGDGPTSASLDVGEVEPAEVATFYESALESQGYATLASSGPREDGSWEIESAGDSECRVRTTVTPLGGTTILEILYGADCPFE
jgi:hypothetical protein